MVGEMEIKMKTKGKKKKKKVGALGVLVCQLAPIQLYLLLLNSFLIPHGACIIDFIKGREFKTVNEK